MTKQELLQAKLIASNIIAILLVLLLSVVAVISLCGVVDLESPPIAMFVGALIGNICSLLAVPLAYYFGGTPSAQAKATARSSATESHDG